MYRFFYTLLFYLLIPLIFCRLWLRGKKAPNYRLRWAERLGYKLPRTKTVPIIWIHSVSVGETLAAVPLVRALLEQYPTHQLLITTTTPTGSERVKAAFADSVLHCYLPYDIPTANKRFIKHFKPDILIIMETELWPNLLTYCHKQQIPTLLANARLSEKSAAGYHKFSALTKPMLQIIDKIAAQTRDDANRFTELGAKLNQVCVSGNIKYDLKLPDGILENSLFMREKVFGSHAKVWIAASTHQHEDEKILNIHRQILRDCPDTRLILVPRHPERFDAVAELCLASNLKLLRRSTLEQADGTADIFLGDSMGELLQFFAMADCAFLGGSLVNIGGHNLLEPAALGLPCVVGLHTYNFREATAALVNVGAALQTDEGEMPRAICIWLKDDEARKKAGQAGQALVIKNRGTLQTLLQLIEELLAKTDPTTISKDNPDRNQD